jgi:MutS domain V
MESPAAFCQRRLIENRGRLLSEQKRDMLLGYAKVADFFGGVIAAIVLLHTSALLRYLPIPVVLFIALAIFQDRVLRRVARSQRMVTFYERALARVEDRWSGIGEPGDRFLDPSHPYARDLDLFGQGSLFQLLCTARTRAGEETLARWLLHPAPPGEVLARQAAVANLRDHHSFRERLFAAGESICSGVHPEALASWGGSTPLFQARWLPSVFGVLGLAWFALAVTWLLRAAAHSLGGLNDEGIFSGPLWFSFVALSLVNLAISRAFKHRMQTAAGAIENACEDLRLLAEVLAVLEAESYTAPLLVGLRDSLSTGRVPASIAVRRLERIVDWLEGRHNLFVRVFFTLCFYGAQFTLLAERWQRRFGPSIRAWLAAVGDFEALASLAGYTFERPDDVFPAYTEVRPTFEALALAHPLLPRAIAVANDLTLGRSPQLIVISGPNMAGKSTFLRGVGLNAVLAQCGAPVRAGRLCLSPLAIGASICILDSLQGGVSRFYAEIQRLKLLSDLAGGPVPLLFLLDELLSGTNSHDRYEGTRFIVGTLLRRGAIGLVTTHDLALTRIPASLNGAAANSHFEDSFVDGRLNFDFKLRPGIVQTSNALRLMQAVGLEVDLPEN